MFLLGLNPYVDAILVLALGFIGLQLIKAFLGPFYGLPVVGSAIKSAVDSVNQAVTNACGSVLSGPSHAVGGSLHSIARFIDRTFGSFRRQAQALLLSSIIVQALALAFHGIRALVHQTARVGHGVTAAVKTLTKEYHGIEHRVKVLERDIAKGIGHDVLPRMKALEREVGKIENRTIPDLRAAEHALENDFTQLGEYIRTNFLSSATDAVTAAVAVALGALGLGGLRCNSLLNSLSKRNCGLWGGLEELLGLFVDTALLANICETLPLMEGLISDVAAPLVVGLTEVGAGVCQNSIGAAPPLQIPPLSLPATSGLALSLP